MSQKLLLISFIFYNYKQSDNKTTCAIRILVNDLSNKNKQTFPKCF